jgi:ATP-dependent protease ClpP protease subunit
MSANKSWYAISNSADDTAQIEITQEIGYYGISAAQFIKDLRPLAGKKIELLINSPGGSIVDGQAIVSALKRHTGGVVAYVYGLAASMASAIACAADECWMATGSMLMIHRASTVSMGDAEDLRKDANLLEKFEKGLVNIYAKKTGMEPAEIEKMLADETWMDALEAVALGFADGITENTPAMAMVTPEQLKARFDKFAQNMATPSNEDAPVVEPVVEPVTEPAPVVEPVVEPVADPDPVVEHSDIPAPNALASTALMERITALQADRDAQSARADAADLRSSLLAAELSAERENIARLEASFGLSAAVVVPAVGAHNDATPTLLDQFNAIADPAEKTAFYRKHEAELKKFLK